MLAVAVVVVATIVATVASILSAATVGEPVIVLAEGKTRPQGGFYTACYPEPRDLNPFTTTELVAKRAVLQFTHEALLDWDPETGALRPALAESYARGREDRTWVFAIRDGVRFSNGQPLTMADVLYTFEVSQKTKAPLGNIAHAMSLIESAEAHGRRLHLRLREQGLSALSTVATGYLVVQRGEVPDRPELPRPGTGPYRLARDSDGRVLWRQGKDLLLVQNPHCWRHTAYRDRWNLAGMRIRFVQDQADCFTLLRQREIDILVDPDVRGLVSKHPELLATRRVCIYDSLRGGNFVLLWNHRRRLLSDARVRRALTMCFDREAIATTLMAGQGRVTSTWFRPGSLEAKDAPNALPYDPVAAGRLLAEHGVEALALEVIIADGQPLHRRILELAQQAMGELPIRLSILPMEWAAMSARLKAHDFDGMLLFMSLDPLEDPFPNFHSKGSLNYMGYRSPGADRLLEDARKTSDPERRLQLYARFNEIFHEDQPVTLLAYPLTGVLLDKRFRDAEPNKLGLYPERWWVRPEVGR